MAPSAAPAAQRFIALELLGADDDCDVRAGELSRAEPVEGADDLHVEVVREARRLGREALAVHDERAGVVRPGGVADRGDPVADAADARRLGGGTARYERSAGHDHHHHVVCGDCGKVEPFSDERLETAMESLAGTLGYELDAHDVVLRGACADCRAA